MTEYAHVLEMMEDIEMLNGISAYTRWEILKSCLKDEFNQYLESQACTKDI